MSTKAISGLWINYSVQDRFLRWTLTLDAYWGVLLSSALTVLIGFAGAAVWTITAFTIHQFRATGEPMDVLRHQTQVLVRNPPSAAVTVWDLLCMCCTWRKKARRACYRLSCLGIAPALIAAVFVLAAVLVAKVASPADRVNSIRVSPRLCGYVNISSASSLPEAQAFAGKNANDSRAAAAYVDACYHVDSSNLGCATLPKQYIETTSSLVSCPFSDKNRCVEQPLQINSGYMNSNRDLGINADVNEQVDVRMVTTCSVITVKDLAVSVPDTSVAHNASDIVIVYLGPVEGVSKFTYSYPARFRNSSLGYTIASAYAYAGSNSSSWIPSSAVRLSYADVTVHFIAANAIQYLASTSSPMFSATNETTPYEDTPLYIPDHYINVVACTEQFEYRDPNNNNASTDLVGFNQLFPRALSLGFNSRQLGTVERLQLALFSARNYDTVAGQGVNALQATKLLSGLISPGLPASQSQLEYTHWFQTGLANFQSRIVDFVNNAWYTVGSESLTGLVVRQASSLPGDDGAALKGQCVAQRVQSAGQYVNFAFSPILIVIISSSLLIILSWILPRLVNLVCCRSERNDGQHGRAPRAEGAQRHKLRAYVADHQLSLARMAVSHGSDGWNMAKTDAPYHNSRAHAFVVRPPFENETSIDYRQPQELIERREPAG